MLVIDPRYDLGRKKMINAKKENLIDATNVSKTIWFMFSGYLFLEATLQTEKQKVNVLKLFQPKKTG